MLRLYEGSGSLEIQLLAAEMQGESWERLRRNACRLLRARQESEAAEVLESTPFELRTGTNSFGDEFAVLYLGTTAEKYAELEQVIDNPHARRAYEQIAKTIIELGPIVRFIAVGVEIDDSVEPVSSPSLEITSEIVEHALRDAEALIQARGPVSGLDRVHTVFHGYLKAACRSAGITYGDDASITELFKVLRENHRSLAAMKVARNEVDRILRSMASIVDALNQLRNRSSVAHPNDSLVEEPEAMLVINSVRTLLHYLNSKLK